VDPAVALPYAAFWVVGIAVQVLIIWWFVRRHGRQKPHRLTREGYRHGRCPAAA